MSGSYPVDYVNIGMVGEFSVNDGGRTPWRAGNTGEMIVQQLYGNASFAELTRRGHVFCANSAAATTFSSIATMDASCGNPVLYNQVSSTKLIIPLYLQLGVVAPATWTTWTGANYAIGYLTGQGDSFVGASNALATAAGTARTVVNMLVGGSTTGRGIYYATVAYATTGASTVLMHTGLSQWLTGTTISPALNINQTIYDFRGMIGLKPGTAIVFGLAATQTTNVVLHWHTMIWAEIPVPPGIS